MAFGVLNEKQAEDLKPYIQGKVVHDLGCGDMQLARELIRLGAASVIAIDKEPPLRKAPTGVTFRKSRFAEVPDAIDVAFISWPPNYECSLDLLAHRAKTIIYLGVNFDGTSCGNVRLFGTLARRAVLSYIPDRESILTVYGDPLEHSRSFTGEEAAGLAQNVGSPWSYEQVLKWGM